MCCIHVTSLRRPRQHPQAVLLPKCRVSSVSWSRGFWLQSLPFWGTFLRLWSGWLWLTASDVLSLALLVPLARFLLLGPGKPWRTKCCAPTYVYTSIWGLQTPPVLVSIPHPIYAALKMGKGRDPSGKQPRWLGCSLFVSSDHPFFPRAPPAPETE